MIRPVSGTVNFGATQQNPQNKVDSGRVNKNSSYPVRYMDSFVKHSVSSVPTLGALTVFWSFVDKTRYGSVPKALGHNIKTFMLPVMVITSAVTAFIENKGPKKENPVKE